MTQPTPPRTPLPQRQRGVTLFVILVLVLLVTLAALWGSRTALFNELFVGNDADYQRAFEAASAMIEDAERDIRGTRSGGGIQLPDQQQDVADFLDQINVTHGCNQGLCVKRTGQQDWWEDAATFSAMQGVGARYGQYTGAGKRDNALLSETGADRGAWYWIEVLPYAENASGLLITQGDNNRALPLAIQPRLVYRITAIAKGQRQGTMVVLQQTYARQTLDM